MRRGTNKETEETWHKELRGKRERTCSALSLYCTLSISPLPPFSFIQKNADFLAPRDGNSWAELPCARSLSHGSRRETVKGGGFPICFHGLSSHPRGPREEVKVPVMHIAGSKGLSYLSFSLYYFVTCHQEAGCMNNQNSLLS